MRERLPGQHNPKLATGDVEVKALECQVLNRCPTPPFELTEFPGEELAGEDLRLQYRFIDLRRPSLQRTIALRHRLNQVIRTHLDREGFLEVETPLLGRSTPEGARDYLVPSRVTPGSWYALPQSPQLYKQLLMVAGYDKYFQIAHCLRDEDLRADRQPEFTQLDLEMAFVEPDDIFRVNEGLVADLFQQCLGVQVEVPLPRLQYAEVMRRYGSDKPDLRYSLEIVDVTDIARRSEFRVFVDAAGRGDVIRALNAKGAATKFSNTDLKPGGKLAEYVSRYGAKGLAWFKVEADKLTSSIEKFFPKPLQDELRQALHAEAGDVLLFVADKEDTAAQALGALRVHLAGQAGPLSKLVGPQDRAGAGGPGRGDAGQEGKPQGEVIAAVRVFAGRLPAGLGRRFSAVRLGRRGQAAGLRTIIRSRPRATRTCTSWRETPARCGPRPMTWCSTATRSAAAAFVFTTPACSSASSRCSA